MLRPFQSDGTFLPNATGNKLRQTAVRSAGAAFAGQAGNFAVGIGSVVILARLLTPSDFGIVTMVTTLSLLFRSFGLNGFTELIIQRQELNETLASNLFWIQLGIGTLLTVAFACSGPLLAAFYHNEAVGNVAMAMSLTIGIGCFGWIHFGLLQRAMQFRVTAIINFMGQLVLVLVSIALAIAGWHYWALVWGSVAQTLVTAAGAWVMCRWIPSWPRRTAGTRDGVKFAGNVYSHFAFNYLTRNTDNLLVGWRFGARVLGFYKKAYDLFVLPETQLLSPLTAVVVGTLSRVRSDREQFQRYFLRAISVLALVGMGIGADFTLVGRELIRIILGPGWEEAGRIFAFFGPGIGVMLLYDTHGWLHLSIGRPERWLRWALIEFACTATLFLLSLRWGPSGIALAWTVSYFLLMLPAFWFAGKPIEMGIKDIASAIWKFFVASVTAAGMTVLLLRMSPTYGAATNGGAWAAFERLISISMVYFAFYLFAVIAIHRGIEPLSQTLSVLRELLPNRSGEQRIPDAEGSQPLQPWSAEEDSSSRDFAMASNDSKFKGNGRTGF
jgi:O-antigen/teichoic acid export membrane protein